MFKCITFTHYLCLFSDIDECGDESLNNCTDNSHCQNLYGTYVCNCESGYYRNGSICEGNFACTVWSCVFVVYMFSWYFEFARIIVQCGIRMASYFLMNNGKSYTGFLTKNQSFPVGHVRTAIGFCSVYKFLIIC